ncbi:MAG: hypothetical protein P1U38_06420 [Aeromicrobium sp.]|uniref:hypothetical protein n=1 Tax=Aeromicrobium sp. TaxID=1871063 RepID=UPI00260D1014|nr:hypothetical protein [Aeromicrobium sp.]MDF1704391.1 hypothetical protein [Aeromicrobium sp.]
MKVQVLHIDECPNTLVASGRVRAALDALGRTDVQVELVLVKTQTLAASTDFGGSPTILVDGQDLFPEATRVDTLACRVYRTSTGLAGSPSSTEIESALRRRNV